MFALSTSWNAWRYSQAKDIIKEVKGLGFSRVELNFSLSPAIVKGMIALKDKGLIEVVSVHNFCPIPSGVSRRNASPDTFSLSSIDGQERSLALRYTKRTIDTASRIGAEVVVFHAGRINTEERLKQLYAVYKNKQMQRYKRLKEMMQQQRRVLAKKNFQQTLKSLDELCVYAGKKKIKLGIENRFYFYEIPSAEEMEIILARFPSPPLFYWHDVGHAQVYENSGLIKHKTLLDKFSRRMCGIHLHDIEGIDDHRAPLKGKFDFARLSPYIKSDTLKVLEPHHPATAEEIVRGKKYLEKILK